MPTSATQEVPHGRVPRKFRIGRPTKVRILKGLEVLVVGVGHKERPLEGIGAFDAKPGDGSGGGESRYYEDEDGLDGWKF